MIAGTALLTACGGGGSSVTPSGSSSATLGASLIDGPFRTSGGTVTAVNIAISKVSQANNTSVTVNGTTYPLSIPSAAGPGGFGNASSTDNGDGGGTSGVKVNVSLNAQALAGSIAGTVKNNAGAAVANAEVLAQQNGTTINSGVTDANGNFQINTLPAGSYTLVIENSWTSQAGQSETATGADGTAAVTDPSSVTVTGGQTATVTLTD